MHSGDSEKYKTPVLFRPTTRVCHAYANIENPEYKGPKEYEGFQKDSKKWVIFPKLSYASHARMEERNVEIGKDFSQYAWNKVEGSSSEKAIIASGISYAYAKEYLKNHEDIRLIKIATAYPFPEDFVRTGPGRCKRSYLSGRIKPIYRRTGVKTCRQI